MLSSTLNKIFGRSAPSGNVSAGDNYDEEIPRYPPFAKGLPVAPIDKVVATQNELVDRIRGALGFTKQEHEELILPVIQRYAEFVHLLPASEAHHHRGAGGLFRHGLEVAFWSAQASESVIFSMEGSPRDRRSNEPRWRLASCFSGLLHDVGKPLSDVSVTDKDGKQTWNPYAKSLYQWAHQHKIERYFLRWRDNRHKRHEQFSLLAIERIIPPNVLQFLSEAGPEILEAMLEAIAGTGTNQPVTKLMLKADQESVARDLKQNRLGVDEFSYGVPVERYVFDAIRRLIKTGKWKVNEPGARVWNLHQGVFITWRQLGDLYDLITKDKIPGIPRDPDTLADILIERGFAIPNTVSHENGESAHYRYWEVCPEILQEGRPAGSVKLLGLRLESHELVFTTEPPVPVKGVIIGERPEPEIAFEDLDNSETASTESAEPVVKEGGGEPEAPRTDDAEDAYQIAASVPPTGAGGASPLEGLLGGADGTDFPFDAFGMEAPAEEVAAQGSTDPSDGRAEQPGGDSPPSVVEPQGEPPEPETGVKATVKPEGSNNGAATEPAQPRSPQKEMFGSAGFDEFDISSLLPNKKPKANAAAKPSATGERKSGKEATASSENGKGKSEGVHGAPQEKEWSPQDKPQTPPTTNTAKGSLEAYLSQQKPAQQAILRKAIFPILEGEATLGEVLCLLQGQAAILYPEGAALLGDPATVLSELWDEGLIAADPLIPGRKVQSVRGIKGLVLDKELSRRVVEALNEVEATREGAQEPPAKSSLRSKKKTRGKKRPPNQITLQHEPTPTVVDTPLETVDANAHEHVKPVEQKSLPETPRQNKTTARRPRQEKARDTQAAEPKPRVRTAVEIPEIEQDGLLPKGKGTLTADFDDIKPKTMTTEVAIEMLKEMIIKREGRWIVSAVTKEGDCLVTSAKAIDMIAGEYPLSKHNLRGHLKRGQDEPLMRIKQGRLYLYLKESVQL
jgi:conjugal transfer pilus assembly protein TraI